MGAKDGGVEGSGRVLTGASLAERAGHLSTPHPGHDALAVPLPQHRHALREKAGIAGHAGLVGQRRQLFATTQGGRLIQTLQQPPGQRAGGVEPDPAIGLASSSRSVGCSGGSPGWKSGPMRCTGQA